MTYANAEAWAAGPDRVYRLLAAAAVATIPGDLAGSLVLDAGAGTGAATHALRARNAEVIAVDISAPMVRLAPAHRVVGDVANLPLRAESVDASIACLLLSHVDDPARALGELARVTRTGGTVTVTAFPAGAGHPVKEAADRVLAAAGYQTPAWYTAIKTKGERRVGTQAALEGLAADAGLHRPQVDLSYVALDGLDHEALVAWRLGMAPVAAWLSTIDPRRRAALAQQVVATLGGVPPLPLLVMNCRR